MRRYENITIYKNQKGRYYKNVIYPNIPLNVNDIYVITGEGDRYDLLANQFYQDSSLWWVISTSNKSLPQDSLIPPIGSQVRIPANISSILSLYKKVNNQ